MYSRGIHKCYLSKAGSHSAPAQMVYCSWRRRGENKPWLRAGRGVVGIAILQLGYRTEQHQRCNLPQIMRLDCRWDLQLCICLPGYMIFDVNSSLLICRRQCIAWLCCLLIFHRKRKKYTPTPLPKLLKTAITIRHKSSLAPRTEGF